MKKIFVTSHEFIQNGGILEVDRPIYNEQKRFIGTFTKNEAGRINVDRGEFGNYSELGVFCLIEIDCTPIYK